MITSMALWLNNVSLFQEILKTKNWTIQEEVNRLKKLERLFWRKVNGIIIDLIFVENAL